jgi:hypothetical protein
MIITTMTIMTTITPRRLPSRQRHRRLRAKNHEGQEFISCPFSF